MNTVRAVLIDPENKTVSEIQTKGNIRDTKAILQCRSFTTGAWLRGTVSKGFDAIMVSDDELDERDDPRFWFQVDADHNPPSSFPIAGRGLAVGVDNEGETCDLQISVEDIAKRITFTQRKFLGFDVQENVGGFDIVVSPIAPIIDMD
jgi:hypothetical protein